MNNQQLKILKYIYNTPRTFSDIKNKFHLDNTALRNLLNGDDNFIDYYNGVQQGKNFDENSQVTWVELSLIFIKEKILLIFYQ